ncbi:hypothetical protein PGTUg99_015268 [Puccinia graminis f. sp. tritici]|uniref:Uncharacterized protein n=1 Tax=Puccinia graminis f. sp. tritici TaxID=56615 RepID=A0A5B0RZM6_PUCGR|nr:hypothetical protein PGTUg99_015268 [Puccinia graminis f. sp. tritici]
MNAPPQSPPVVFLLSDSRHELVRTLITCSSEISSLDIGHKVQIIKQFPFENSDRKTALSDTLFGYPPIASRPSEEGNRIPSNSLIWTSESSYS